MNRQLPRMCLAHLHPRQSKALAIERPKALDDGPMRGTLKRTQGGELLVGEPQRALKKGAHQLSDECGRPESPIANERDQRLEVNSRQLAERPVVGRPTVQNDGRLDPL